MNIRKKPVIFLSLICLLIIQAYADDPGKIEPLRSVQIENPPKIDGELADQAWNRLPDIDGFFITYSPVNGDQLPERTKVWISNDKENIYFAFYCYDSHPGLIKNSITKHDDIWNDDWIGFNLDPLGNKTFGYVLVSNPSGIQADIFDSPTAGSDDAPDYVWYSSGKLVEDGYTVEIQVPLRNFKYKQGKNVEMNIIFERKITRLGVAASWPAVPVGQTFFSGMGRVIIPEIDSYLSLQAIPSLTYTNAWTRKNPDSWNKGKGNADLGITAKIGITSRISAEGTYNPDFSHIESDAFQVLINQRYPIYYSEKRPFFMEAANIFNIAGGNLGGKNLISAVHTRNIVDPLWGAKITGEAGNWAFGFLSAGDQFPGRDFSLNSDGQGTNPFQGKVANYAIGRIKYILNGENQIGTIVTDREFAGGYNRVAGFDMNLRLGEGNHWLRSNIIGSLTKDENTLQSSKGLASNVAYSYLSRRIEFRSDYEFIGNGFDMATAFINRKGLSKLSAMLWLNLYPGKEGYQWIKKITPLVYGNLLRDLGTEEYDNIWKAGVNFNFVRQGTMRIEYQRFREFWAGMSFTGGFFNMYGGAQITNWLRASGQLNTGARIYYSETDPFVGTGISTQLQVTFQPNEKFTQLIQYQFQNLLTMNEHEKIFDVNILIANTTYQVNRHLFLRAILQFDSSSERLLGDALVSYELVPGTVFQLGYGSLSKKLFWDNDHWVTDSSSGEYYHSNQSIFVKLSYLFQR